MDAQFNQIIEQKLNMALLPLHLLIYSASIIALSALRHESLFDFRLMQKAMKSRALIPSAFAFRGLQLEGG